MVIIKRNGSTVHFDKSKIEAAQLKAFAEVDKNEVSSEETKVIVSAVAESIANIVKIRAALKKPPLTVEECQDLVVAGLTAYRPDVAEVYENYRSSHNKARDKEIARQQTLIKNIKSALTASNVSNSNANVDEYSFSGCMGEVANAAAKDDALNERISAKVVANHVAMRIYIHDLDRYSVGMHNCAKRSTKFVTIDGVRSFEDFEDGDVVTVLTHTGEFKPATVRKYGVQQLNKIEFVRSGSGISVCEYFTSNHRWLLADETITTNLKVGDKLMKAPKIKNVSEIVELWTINSITPDTLEEVWCLEVQDNHSFVLPNGIVTGNCLSIPFDDLLAKGFIARNMDVRPAGRLSTAFQQMAVIFQLQSQQQFGGVSATHLDWTMVPYVRKSLAKHFRAGLHWMEGMSKDAAAAYVDTLGEITLDDTALKKLYPKAWGYAVDNLEYEAYQSVEAFYHNLNTLQSRSGGQLPFTSINYGTCTLPEGRLIIKTLLDISIEGLGAQHRTSIFPCSIMQLGKGINLYPGDPNYDLFKLALKSTSQRLYPNYANIDWSGNAGYDRNDPRSIFSTMGCRTANGWDINGMGQIKDGRGNIAPTTIIMPMLAMEAVEEVRDSLVDESEPNEENVVNTFMRILDEAIHDAKDALIERFEYICSKSPKAAEFMWVNNVMAGYVPEEGIRSAMKHGTLAIGQIGLAETLQILIGCDHTTDKGMELAKKIEQLFKDRCAEFKEAEKLNFGVYYTPAENLCYKAMKAFQDKYGVIKDVSDKEFFTNSIHVPVWKNVNPFEKIDIESKLTGYSSAGCITYVEFDAGAKYNLEALEAVVVYAMEKDIPYFAINVPVDTCVECGYTDQIGEACPICGGTHIQRLRRVTGYINGDYESSFNYGKQQEVAMRFVHSKLLSNRVYTRNSDSQSM